MSEPAVCLELFLSWLNGTYQRHFRWDEFAALASDGSERLAIQIGPLIGPSENREWLSARERLQEQIAAAATLPIAVWLPAGAELPADEPATSDFIERVREVAVNLAPHERSHVALPVRLLLRKSADTGGVVSATGGLNQYWARFTEHVRGTYDLDSTRLHRLPESEEHLQQLIDTIIERAAKLEAGQIAEIQTVDAWTVQRLAAGEGVTIVGNPPAATQDMGLVMRRNFRRILADAGPQLRDQAAELRALVVLGPYARIEDEGATTAMRGYDPTLYSGIDFVCLIADGLVKPLIHPPSGLLPWKSP